MTKRTPLCIKSKTAGIPFSRRSFCALLAFLGASTVVQLSFMRGVHASFSDGRYSLNHARSAFALAIAYQRDGHTVRAQKSARECLVLLKHCHTMEETAAGGVVAVGEHVICEPDFLHTDTALRRFSFAGIHV